MQRGSQFAGALRFDGVTCVRGGRTLFDSIGFELRAGDALLVSGPNGVGKSSLLRLAAGLLQPMLGTIECDGEIALLDEHLALDPVLPLARALGFWAAIDGGDPMSALAAVGLDHLASVPVRMLSTGQRRRAALARTLASGAVIWLLDEPSNGLDVVGVTMLEGLIAAHRLAGGIVVVATHQPLTIAEPRTLALGA